MLLKLKQQRPSQSRGRVQRPIGEAGSWLLRRRRQQPRDGSLSRRRDQAARHGGLPQGRHLRAARRLRGGEARQRRVLRRRAVVCRERVRVRPRSPGAAGGGRGPRGRSRRRGQAGDGKLVGSFYFCQKREEKREEKGEKGGAHSLDIFSSEEIKITLRLPRARARPLAGPWKTPAPGRWPARHLLLPFPLPLPLSPLPLLLPRLARWCRERGVDIF